jgi:hypothetical protein
VVEARRFVSGAVTVTGGSDAPGAWGADCACTPDAPGIVSRAR